VHIDATTLDDTGKVTLDHLYVQDDPRPYFRALHRLDYCIPQQAKPHFARIIREYRAATGVEEPTVVDVGCSYGVNALLLRADATIGDLYQRYAGPGTAALDRDELLARDRALVRDNAPGVAGPVRFVGLDSSAPALAYARDAGLVDDAIHTDLERHDPGADERRQLAAADLVVSTGCIGYVGAPTLRRVAQAGGRRPWMAHFVLRMFPYQPVTDGLRPLGYETLHVDGLFRQRRFASPEERSRVLDRLTAIGIDPEGREADGWLYAQLFLSRPTSPRPEAPR
jgi:carnitine O-acetyltransferase